MPSSLSASRRNGRFEHVDSETVDSDNAIDISTHDEYLAYAGSKNSDPSLLHRIQNKKSILALVVSSSNIYAGTQGGEILVIDMLCWW